MSHSLIVLPEDTAQPILDALSAAKRPIQIRMFLFTDPGLTDAVIAAKRRGVKIRVMLNPARRRGESENDETKAKLEQEGIEVRDSNPAFQLTHQKSMVVDDEIGFVESFNWETRALTATRDYAVVTTHKTEVAEMVACFEADWVREGFTPSRHSELIWCPNNGRERIADFIDSAKHSLWVQNERYQDMVIIERLVRAVVRGVRLHILARSPHTLKKDKLVEGVGGLRIVHDVGGKVHALKGLKLHAKMILADERRAIVGSINLSPGSFDGRRELAVETDAHHVVRRLSEAAQTDWTNSHKLDLTDAGLLKDLAKRSETADGADLLVLKRGSQGVSRRKSEDGGTD
jgi:cardiolipin synthase A/B